MNTTKRASRDCGTTVLTNLATGKVDLNIDFANSFTMNITSDTVAALKRGKKAIVFQNPMEGTVALEIQVWPFELYTIFGDGTIGEGGDFVHAESIKCKEAGKLEVPKNVKALEVFSRGNVGAEDGKIDGSSTDGTFTATTADDIVKGKVYDIVYVATGGKTVAINDNLQMPDYKLDTDILTKNEVGVWKMEHITCYKATAQRNIELAYAAEGDPATLTITFDLLVDEDENFVELMTPAEEEDDTQGEP